MNKSIFDSVIHALQQAAKHNSHIMVKPEVILWPDYERQWQDVIPDLQATLPQLLVYGPYEPAKKQGPSIWIKWMVGRLLPEPDWPANVTPIIYLPGISKNDLRNVEEAGLDLQPLIEYQYTGTLFTQENGKEWTVLAFVENQSSGLGLQIAKDSATKLALKKALPAIFQDQEILYGKSLIDSDYLNAQLFPDIVSSLLKWLCRGDVFLDSLNAGRREVFVGMCASQYGFEPDYRNIKDITEKFGAQRGAWKNVWQLYAASPRKYPELESLLRLAKPDDLGTGFLTLPEESWPQVNEQKEEELRKALAKAAKLHPSEAVAPLADLEKQHQVRRQWVWAELGQSPLLHALSNLHELAALATESIPGTSVKELQAYYTDRGYRVDQAMRKSLAAVRTEKDKKLVKSLIQSIYKPWLESITDKFQGLIQSDATIFTSQLATAETENFVLFVDAFRYELAREFCERLPKKVYKVELTTGWSALPSVTPTAKPNVSPMATLVSTESDIKEFRPQLKSSKDLLTPAFREALKTNDFQYIAHSSELDPNARQWQEIGNIDTKGHEEQADMVRRVEELFDLVQETLDTAFEQGIKRVKIVTDHGWLLLPGGLPKTQLNPGLADTRWGRCALIKEGAKTDLLHVPWRWNPAVFIAYAPGITFFKANQEYAHGGITLHECLVPTLLIENLTPAVAQARITQLKWVNLKCSVQTEGADDTYTLDIRSKYHEETTSIVEAKIRTMKDNKGWIMVSDDAESQAATVVLLDASGRILDKKLTTVGG